MRKGTCKHFNGTTHNKECAAGVCYRDVMTEPDRMQGSLLRLPCHSQLIFKNASPSQIEEFNKRGTCSKYQEPTDEDVAEHEASMKRYLGRFMLVQPLIGRIKRTHKGNDWRGVEECPACKGKLHLSHSSYNGHVWGKCETENCLSWME